jgi:hypothetical protein
MMILPALIGLSASTIPFPPFALLNVFEQKLISRNGMLSEKRVENDFWCCCCLLLEAELG